MRILKNERIGPALEAELDVRLAEMDQTRLVQMVASLPDEEPALAWRSTLSERLHKTARQNERRRKIAWTLRPALGLGLGAAMALAFIATNEVPYSGPVASSSLEEQIASAHLESVQAEQFWGGIRAGEEVRVAAAPAVREYSWEESDLGTL